MKSRLWSVVMVAPLALLAVAPVAGCSKGSDAASSDAKTYSTKGTIKSFGPEKKFANIAHETIPGYMAAMTMSFEPSAPAQLDGLNAGDKVEFTFKPEGGKHILTSIKKAP